MRLLVICTVLALQICSSTLAADISYQDDASLADQLTRYTPIFRSIDDFIIFMERTTASVEYKKARVTEGDGSRVCILFTLEQGLNYMRHLAVLQVSGGKGFSFVDELVVGGRGIREVDAVRLAGDNITLSTREYGGNDAMCCPSVPGEMTARIEKGRILLTK